MRSFTPLGSGTVGVGLIGAGNISDTYLENLNSFPDISVLIVGDLDRSRSAAQAAKHGVPASGSADDVLAHPDVELVINLTIPAVHAAVSSAAISAGKHVWSEKPIAIDRASAAALLDQADAAGLRVGVAPDTVLGPGVQSAKRAIERGDIGRPLFAQTTMQWQGPEIFHPDPAFLFATGAGPLFDMGPYYFSTLVHVLGPVASVAALGLKARENRTVLVGPKAGETFPVEIPSTINVLAEFEGGAHSQSMLSTDSPLLHQGFVQISGTEGTILLPDPNMFTGRSSLIRPLSSTDSTQEWIELAEEGAVVGRGLGALDMARAIRGGTSHRATGELGYHVLDTMLAAEESAELREFVEVRSTADPIEAMPVDFDPFAASL
ncbi:Gfo/Idh/MocA family oxidoreductase [Salinibacterium sp. G-O1]|uniref:Gfo/Idh/MocA family protein n=1 Tax=Salinibacterium sp. G-O1 TaxID=3046208 RepID=UPI0024B913E5|nr:Gfo/Idh/MocA family oxidoreductase [Salinibacterium sp. G-O1]MDJ0334941.1 Gfo/Idh/MocA family oxidoreductase [Salinibacterium sp. G-O1]